VGWDEERLQHTAGRVVQLQHKKATPHHIPEHAAPGQAARTLEGERAHGTATAQRMAHVVDDGFHVALLAVFVIACARIDGVIELNSSRWF
jgi:hypothetical protein